jgi:formylglycine-generating enzyme
MLDTRRKALNQDNMVFIDAGIFMMGSDKFYQEEKPMYKVRVRDSRRFLDG